MKWALVHLKRPKPKHRQHKSPALRASYSQGFIFRIIFWILLLHWSKKKPLQVHVKKEKLPTGGKTPLLWECKSCENGFAFLSSLCFTSSWFHCVFLVISLVSFIWVWASVLRLNDDDCHFQRPFLKTAATRGLELACWSPCACFCSEVLPSFIPGREVTCRRAPPGMRPLSGRECSTLTCMIGRTRRREPPWLWQCLLSAGLSSLRFYKQNRSLVELPEWDSLCSSDSFSILVSSVK